jgi:hypothetical protein
MNTNEIHVILVKAKSTKSSRNDAQVERNAVPHFQTLLLLLEHRTVLIPVLAFIALFSVGISNAQTALVNGGNQGGTILTNTTDSYTFTANKGDSIVLRLGTTGFDGNLGLYGPSSVLVKTAASGMDAELDYTATNSGTFTVIVSSYYSGGTGTYVLHLAQSPEPFIVPAGDEGGPMTNGGNFAGR